VRHWNLKLSTRALSKRDASDSMLLWLFWTAAAFGRGFALRDSCLAKHRSNQFREIFDAYYPDERGTAKRVDRRPPDPYNPGAAEAIPMIQHGLPGLSVMLATSGSGGWASLGLGRQDASRTLTPYKLL